jgi:hypothetical protein
MTRLALATLLCALGTTQASAQNVVSQGLLELNDEERNASFTLLLRDSDRRCDQVTRTLFTGTLLGVDEWRRSAKTETPTRLAFLVEPDGTTITSLTCRELKCRAAIKLARQPSSTLHLLT